MASSSRSSTNSATTADLVRAACARDSTAWEELVVRYSTVVRRVVANFHFSEAEAADAAQNTWLCALEKLDTLRDPDRLGGWLKTIARRECLHTYRRIRREIPYEMTAFDRDADTPGPDDTTLKNHTRWAVDKAVDELSEPAQNIIRMLFYQEESRYKEIAHSMSIPIGSIGPTRQRALNALRRHLESTGHIDPLPAAG